MLRDALTASEVVLALVLIALTGWATVEILFFLLD